MASAARSHTSAATLRFQPRGRRAGEGLSILRRPPGLNPRASNRAQAALRNIAAPARGTGNFTTELLRAGVVLITRWSHDGAARPGAQQFLQIGNGLRNQGRVVSNLDEEIDVACGPASPGDRSETRMLVTPCWRYPQNRLVCRPGSRRFHITLQTADTSSAPPCSSYALEDRLAVGLTSSRRRSVRRAVSLWRGDVRLGVEPVAAAVASRTFCIM